MPRIWVPDNLKSAVTRADNYEVLVNRDFLGMANHCGAGKPHFITDRVT